MLAKTPSIGARAGGLIGLMGGAVIDKGRSEMRMPRVLISSFAAAFIAAASYAQGTQPGERWQFARQTEFKENIAWNYGRQNGSLSEIGVTCGDAGPYVYFADGGYYDVESYKGTLSISIDGQDYSRVATFIPDDTGNFWRMEPSDGLLDALRKGDTAVARSDMVDGAFSFGLRGSSAAIGQVVSICGDGSRATSSSDGLSVAAAENRVRMACQGSYSGEAVIVEANVDGDGSPDFLIDWVKVSCASTAVGRGGGNCGMQMCSIDLYASSVYEPDGWPQPILAYSYELAEAGDDHVMRTTLSGASCPITHRCTRFWGWNGSELEVVRSEDVDVSGGNSTTRPPPDSSPAGLDGAGNDVQRQGGMATAGAGDQGNIYTPGQWSGQVTEGTYGFAHAIFSADSGDNPFTVVLACGPTFQRGLSTSISHDYVRPGGGFEPSDVAFLRLAGEDFRIVVHEGMSTVVDAMELQTEWEGQSRMLGLLNAGHPMQIVVLKGGDPENVVQLAEVPGSEGNTQYAAVLEACGKGSTFKVQANQAPRAQESATIPPGAPDDLVRSVFEENGCVLSESQLLQFFRDAGYGLAGANSAVIAVANRPDVDPLPNDRTSFRFVGSEYCGF